jgi:hypothetical protein
VLLTEKRPENSVLAYEMLELHAQMLDWVETLENLGIIGKWLPGVDLEAKALRMRIIEFRVLMEMVMMDGFGYSLEDIHRMEAEINDPDMGKDEEWRTECVAMLGSLFHGPRAKHASRSPCKVHGAPLVGATNNPVGLGGSCLT